MNTSGRTGRPVPALLPLLLLSSLLSGCAVSPPQHGDDQARELLAERGLTVTESASESGDEFRGELSRQQAVQAALLNHPSMRAEYARLEIASADVVRASELLNPTLSLSWLDVSGGGTDFSVGLSQSLAGVMLRPARRRMAEAEYELAVLTLAESLQSLALETEAAWHALAAAEQRLQLQRWASNTALWADQLGERFAAAGNITPLKRAQLTRRAAEAELTLLQAERDRDQARSELALQLALTHDDWQVSTALPLPVNGDADTDSLIADALQNHPALLQVSQRKTRLQQQLGGEKRQRWLDDAEVGVEHERSGDERATGPTLGFRLPLWHRSRGNLSMWNHPIHLHGVQFHVTGSDGGRWPKSQWRSEVTEIVGVGQARDIEFIAVPGDWAFHCHMSHHTMNAMGHDIPNTLGVDQSGIDAEIRKLLPGYMAMGQFGMGEHQEHTDSGHMRGPDNTLPMMMGKGPFGNIEMGGMFTLVKTRDDIAPGDFRDPGWYQHPAGTLARRISSNPDYGSPARRGTPVSSRSETLPTPSRQNPHDHH